MFFFSYKKMMIVAEWRRNTEMLENIELPAYHRKNM